MNDTIDRIVLATAAGLALSVTAPGQIEDRLWPITVEISPAKKELLPGQTMEIILTSMMDLNGNHAGPGYKVIVASMGMIVNGENSPIPHGKEFVIGEDNIIRVHYVAPSLPASDTDTITVYRSPDLPEEVGTPEDDDLPMPSEVIGTKKIKLVNSEFLRVTRYDYEHHESSSGKAWSTREVEVTMILRFRPMGGMGFSIPYDITSAEVVSFSGSIKRSDGEHAELTGATVGIGPRAMNMHMSGGTGDVEAVVPTAFSAKLEWASTEDLAPPRDLDFGPVTNHDGGDAQKALRAERTEIKRQIRSGDPGSLERLFELQHKIAAATVHPDQKVTFRNSEKNFGGKAEYRKETSSHRRIARYSWEVVMK